MGFSTLQSEAAIHQYATVQSALEALLAGKGNSLMLVFFLTLSLRRVIVDGQSVTPPLTQ